MSTCNMPRSQLRKLKVGCNMRSRWARSGLHWLAPTFQSVRLWSMRMSLTWLYAFLVMNIDSIRARSMTYSFNVAPLTCLAPISWRTPLEAIASLPVWSSCIQLLVDNAFKFFVLGNASRYRHCYSPYRCTFTNIAPCSGSDPDTMIARYDVPTNTVLRMGDHREISAPESAWKGSLFGRLDSTFWQWTQFIEVDDWALIANWQHARTHLILFRQRFVQRCSSTRSILDYVLLHRYMQKSEGSACFFGGL